MDISAALKAGQRAAVASFTDTVSVERATGNMITDPVTAQVTEEVISIYVGKGKIQATGASVNTPTAGGAQFTVETTNLHLPIGAGPLKINDTAKITAAPMNPARVGQTFRITGLNEKSHATAQRLKVERVTA